MARANLRVVVNPTKAPRNRHAKKVTSTPAAQLAAAIDAVARRVVRMRGRSRAARFAENPARALVAAPCFDLPPAELRSIRLSFVVSVLLAEGLDREHSRRGARR